MPAHVSTVESHALRPHDVVVSAPDDDDLVGQEVQLVFDRLGLPFAGDRGGPVRVVFRSGRELYANARDAWQVERHALDDCRPCFLYETLAPEPV